MGVNYFGLGYGVESCRGRARASTEATHCLLGS